MGTDATLVSRVQCAPSAMAASAFARYAFLALGLTVMVAFAWGCVRSVPRPSYVPQPQGALVEVPYPPPPGRVELIAAARPSGAVYIDGEWTWTGRRWSWRKGRWVVPPQDAKFSPWAAVRGEDGVMYVASGVWRNAKGDEVPEPPPVRESQLARGTVIDTEGEPEPVGPSRSMYDTHNSDAGSDATAPGASEAEAPP